ncbi:glycosyltransferase family 2 protein [Methanosarcina mazei]|uniref:Glycosyl transferase n=1 Tax=Methanosarcina mazei TaxID=2209 RepID=A0A0F8MP77_METMZ|nr:glycosyltransferase family 2 protein [Methanosarcina mazei]KKH40463.1 glycosyl transferase [Methanosarcina mazei]KKH44634.1 glycosyl transferase [Methanosarcina mazei]
MYRKKSIGVAIPAYNESKLIEKTLGSVPPYVDKIYAVDDGSKDDTAEKIKNFDDSRIVLIQQKNGGVGAAVTAGYKKALEDHIDIVAVMAGDNQMDPQYLPDLLDPIIDGKAEYTKGNRLVNSKYRKGMSAWRSLGNYILSFLNKIASGYWDLEDPQNGYTAISSRALKKLNLNEVYKGYAFENDMLVKLNIHDVSVKNVAIPARYADEKSKIRYSRFILKTSFYFIKALIWRSWNKYVVKLNPIGAMYLMGSLLTVTGFFALFVLDVLYLLLGFSLFGVAAFSEILRNKLLDTKFSKEVEVTPLNE